MYTKQRRWGNRCIVVILAAMMLFGLFAGCAKGEGDTTAPEIIGSKTVIYAVAGEPFDALEGISAVDDTDGDITDKIKVTTDDPDAIVAADGRTVTFENSGDYLISYDVTDAAGNPAQTRRSDVEVSRRLQKTAFSEIGLKEGEFADNSVLTVDENSSAAAEKTAGGGRLAVKVTDAGEAADDVLLSFPAFDNKGDGNYRIQVVSSADKEVKSQAFISDGAEDYALGEVVHTVNAKADELTVARDANILRFALGNIAGQAEAPYTVYFESVSADVDVPTGESVAYADFSQWNRTASDIVIRGNEEERTNAYKPEVSDGKLTFLMNHCNDANEEGKNYSGGRSFGIPINGIFRAGEEYTFSFKMQSDLAIGFSVQTGILDKRPENEWEPAITENLTEEVSLNYSENGDGCFDYSAKFRAGITTDAYTRLFIWFKLNNQEKNGQINSLAFYDFSFTDSTGSPVAGVTFKPLNEAQYGVRGLKEDGSEGYTTELQYNYSPRIASDSFSVALKSEAGGMGQRRFMFKMQINSAINERASYRIRFKLDAAKSSRMAFHIGKDIDDSNIWDYFCEERVFTWKEFAFTGRENAEASSEEYAPFIYDETFVAERSAAVGDPLYFWFECNDESLSGQINDIRIYDVAIEEAEEGGISVPIADYTLGNDAFRLTNSGGAYGEKYYDKLALAVELFRTEEAEDSIALSLPIKNEKAAHVTVSARIRAEGNIGFRMKTSGFTGERTAAAEHAAEYNWQVDLSADDTISFLLGNQEQQGIFRLEFLSVTSEDEEFLPIRINFEETPLLSENDFWDSYLNSWDEELGKGVEGGAYFENDALVYKVSEISYDVDWRNKIQTKNFTLKDEYGIIGSPANYGFTVTLSGPAGGKVGIEFWKGNECLLANTWMLDGTRQEFSLSTDHLITPTETETYRVEIKFGYAENAQIIESAGEFKAEILRAAIDVYR